MLSVFALLLSSNAPTLEHLSLSERNLLQSAVHTYSAYQVIKQHYESCQTDAEYRYIGLPEASQLRAMLESKLNINYQDFLFALQHAKSWQTLKPRYPLTAGSCDDISIYRSNVDQYELELFSLEIADPLTKPLLNNPQQEQANQQREQLLTSYLARSHTIAIADVIDRQTLSAVEQANFLHLQYQSRYIFKITQGWRNVPPIYMGMHVQINDTDLGNYSGKWLIFLDQQRQFVSARPLTEVSDFIEKLGKPDWSIDNSGNLQRHNQ